MHRRGFLALLAGTLVARFFPKPLTCPHRNVISFPGFVNALDAVMGAPSSATYVCTDCGHFVSVAYVHVVRTTAVQHGWPSAKIARIDYYREGTLS